MKGKSSGELNGFLDSGAVFKGELEFEDTMRIDGRFNGKIVSKNELIVGESATIEGDIHVGRIAISGTVIGKIVAAQRVEIHAIDARTPRTRSAACTSGVTLTPADAPLPIAIRREPRR